MFSKLAVALAAVSLVSAQTWTDCNPLKETCKPDPAFGKNGANCDFTKGACDAFHVQDGKAVTYDSRGAIAQMTAEGQAPTLASNDFLFFGRVEVEMQAAPGKGIVTSIVLISKDLDEVDFETVGFDNKQIQSNYFSKGDDTVFDRGGFHNVDNPLGAMHTYSFEWTPEKIEWIINGAIVRTLKRSDVGEAFPQSPMQVKLGAWVAGYKGNREGTLEWVGGIADFTQGPSTAIYKSVKVVDYAGGSSATSKDVKEYVYSDHSGSAKSIKVVLNDGSISNKNEAASGSSSASASGSKTSTTAKSSTATSSEASITSSAQGNSTSTVTTATSTHANATSTLKTTASQTVATTTAPAVKPSSAASNAGVAIGAVAFFLAALAI